MARIITSGSAGGDRFPRRTGTEEGGRHGDPEEDSEDSEEHAAESTLVRLLRHEAAVARGGETDNRGLLAWISANRVWLVPYASALFVVLLEVAVALWASRPLPTEAHAVIIWFLVFAIGRGTSRRNSQRRREAQIARTARSIGLPPDELRDEFVQFLAQRSLPPGRSDL